MSTPDKEDDQAWLRYWVIISIFYLAEYLLDLLHFLPFYHVFKISFIIWCLLPDPLSGSKILFELVKVVLTVFLIRQELKNKEEGILSVHAYACVGHYISKNTNAHG